MNKNTAIGITIATALLCGCPGLVLAVMGIMAAFGSQVPEVMAQNPNSPQDVLLGSGMFLCFGAILILIPIVAGILSFRAAKSNTPPSSDFPSNNEPMPPAS